MSSQQLEGGTYEVIRKRLTDQAGDLRSRLDALNTDRQQVFGAVEPALIATERVSTEHNCVPRDMVSIGEGRFLFGYNIQFGLKSTTDIADVFAVYHWTADEQKFTQDEDLANLVDPQFLTDFREVFRYYKTAVFAKFMVIGPHLFAAFHVGRDVTDLKTFKFLIPGDGTLKYVGNRSDHEYVFPTQQDFTWKRAHREMQRSGEHPHVSIEDKIFVETVGGDLTIKIEDNTATGTGIYSEDVTDPDQSLDDAEFLYATIGSLILLKILPYREKDHRYLVYNEKVQTVTRCDAIEDSCVLLPEDHGIIFANGYLLDTGEAKVFDTDLDDMHFERRIASANGEDFLYIFYNRRSGHYILLPYNLISQQVETPIVCNGYSLFPDGVLLYFRTEDEPGKHHAIQAWRTPYLNEEAQAAAAAQGDTDSLLFKVGNSELVRAMAECHKILGLLAKDDSYGDLYIDLAKRAGGITDAYFWVGKPEAYDLATPLTSIRGAAQSAIDEFDKVKLLRKQAREETSRIEGEAQKLLSQAEHSSLDDINAFVHLLADLRRARGETIGLREMRYVDGEVIDSLEERIAGATETVSGRCVEFLLQPTALDPYRQSVDEKKSGIPDIAKVAEAKELEELMGETGEELEMLIDIVGNLKIDDATQTTQIIDDVSTIFASLNQAKVELRNRRDELARTEGAAQFGAQLKLLGQSVVNYLDLADDPNSTEEYLTKAMVQLEELDGQFGDIPEFAEQIADRREEIYSAFETRKQTLIEKRDRRSNSLVSSAERILSGVSHRLEQFDNLEDIHGYLAADLMVDKVRDIISDLEEIGDSTKADDLRTRLKTLGEDTVRQLKDKKELFVDGENVIRFGNHGFTVNTTELQLSIVPRDGDMCFHLGGTDYFERIQDERFLGFRDIWEQSLISESDNVYRSEYLAYHFAQTHPDYEFTDKAALLGDIQAFMGPRYAEGYTKGVHDEDAGIVLETLLPARAAAGLLTFAPQNRALGLLALLVGLDVPADRRELKATDPNALPSLITKIRASGHLRHSLDSTAGAGTYLAELRDLIDPLTEHATVRALLPEADPQQAAEYLLAELSIPVKTEPERFPIPTPSQSQAAHDLLAEFKQTLTGKRLVKPLDAALQKLPTGVDQFQLLHDWLTTTSPEEELAEPAIHYLLMALHGARPSTIATALSTELEGLLGSHPSISNDKALPFSLPTFLEKLRRFEECDVPRYRDYHHLKTDILETKREDMRLEEFKPKVMSAFVRNKLLNDVFLPLIGDNLAKQLGTAGDSTRTDRMGMLLLISPPGYGKTTLMEYVANRLGVTFMKINGPAIGHEVTSLDPGDAPNLGAREEIEKLNLALEMGDNVLLYLDDIQHCNPEFLQKFISLCDAQRKIEGVYKGRARTYDLRGKKVAVVMAGNPYTESGGRFQIPDMLANRADTYNLGDIIGGHADAFKGSYIENSLTSNSVLQRLSSRSQKDVYAIMRMAETGSQEGIDLEGNYSPEEIADFSNVVAKLYRVRDVILKVNLEYIRSAAQSDDYRTEPPFKLQGSYRNMNRIAEKVIPLMTEQEIDDIVLDHYQNESQTLTTGAESNLLKFREMLGILTDEETERWDGIKKTFSRNLKVGGGDTDPVDRLVGVLADFGQGLGDIRDTITKSAAAHSAPQTLGDQTIEQLEKIIASLRSVPVDVQINVLPVEEGSNSELPVDVQSKTKQG